MPKSTPRRRTSIRHDGLLIHQRDDEEALPIFVFSATASQIFKWAKVTNTSEKRGAAQRVYSETHAKSICAYIEASTENIIPTAVTLSLPDGSFKLTEWQIDDTKLSPRTQFASLTISTKSSPGLIIDGQHRLRALENFGDIPLVCSAILGASPIEHALHFLIINNKAKRVSQDLVKGIVNEMSAANRELFQQRIQSVHLTLGASNNGLRRLRTEKDSPFREYIDWDINRKTDKRVVKPNALEGSLRLITNKIALELDLDESVEILKAIWNGIYKERHSEWAPTPPHYLTKAAFVALTDYIVQTLNADYQEGIDISEVQYITDRSAKIFSQLPEEFWTTKWAPKGLDTSAGRELIVQALGAVRGAANRGVADPLAEASDFFDL